MAFGAFVGAGFEVAAGGVAAFGVNYVAAPRAIAPFKVNAGFCERQSLDPFNALAADVGRFQLVAVVIPLVYTDIAISATSKLPRFIA